MNAPLHNPEERVKKRKLAHLRASLTRWHRRLGLVAAAFVLVLSLTGILLSHADRFSLYEKSLSPWLATTFYSFKAPTPIGVELDGRWLLSVDGYLFLSGTALDQQIAEFRGAAFTGQLLVAAGPSEMLVLTSDGELIEHLNGAMLPATIDRVGLTADNLIALEGDGDLYVADSDLLTWRNATQSDTISNWSNPTSALPTAVKTQALQAHGVGNVTTHRFIADVHSGRIMGPFGPFIMDMAAVIFMALAGTGIYMWWRQRRPHPRSRRQK
ncbi:PepSY domain-containing protein [Kordiimonas sp.]|uniref:PepSY domain-containing protein n=1 Tax=Kordiimonas sp. TaxID=1970157 RepID=UPI003A9204A4